MRCLAIWKFGLDFVRLEKVCAKKRGHKGGEKVFMIESNETEASRLRLGVGPSSPPLSQGVVSHERS